MVIAIFGGAFDPVHRDHLRMAQAALDFGYCEQVWMLPSPDRWDKHPRTSAALRLQMLSVAMVSQSNHIIPCDFELKMGEYRGSYFLLQALVLHYPQHEFRLLIGADTVPFIPEWRDATTFNGSNHNGEQLLQEFSLIVYPRIDCVQPSVHDFIDKKYRQLFNFCDAHERLLVEPGVDASHLLRSRLWNDPEASKELPAGVWELIQAERLYTNT